MNRCAAVTLAETQLGVQKEEDCQSRFNNSNRKAIVSIHLELAGNYRLLLVQYHHATWPLKRRALCTSSIFCTYQVPGRSTKHLTSRLLRGSARVLNTKTFLFPPKKGTSTISLKPKKKILFSSSVLTKPYSKCDFFSFPSGIILPPSFAVVL